MSESKRFFVTGATGFVGREVVRRLLQSGHQVVAVSRNPQKAERQLGPDVLIRSWDQSDSELADDLSSCDVALSLAGEPIAGRWSKAKKDRVLRSRVESTRKLTAAMSLTDSGPKVLVAASAVGYYGHVEQPTDETAAVGDGFLAGVCEAWEEEATRGAPSGVRVVLLRLGIVLGRKGGALAPMLAASRFGMLGRLGSGDQAVAWIHLHDAAELFVAAALDQRFSGPINAVAGHVPQSEFVKTICQATGRRVGLGVPGGLVRTMLGDSAALVLDSSAVEPRALTALGFKFSFPDLEAALRQVADSA